MQATPSLAERLAPILEPTEPLIRTKHFRVAPSAFNSSEPYLRALPLAREWSWPTLEEHLKRFSPETVLLQLPAFWQLEPFASAAARAAQAPVCNIETQNFPLDKAAVRFASANTVIAEASEALAIAEYVLKENSALPPFWFIVHAADAPNFDTPQPLTYSQTEIAEEVHLAPGVPLLVQCAAAAQAKKGYYHYSDLFTWSNAASGTTISTKGTLLFTLQDFALPFTLMSKGACPCGRELFARANPV